LILHAGGGDVEDENCKKRTIPSWERKCGNKQKAADEREVEGD
jgi:hypothetical protein